jgi:hypothetical protein
VQVVLSAGQVNDAIKQFRRIATRLFGGWLDQVSAFLAAFLAGWASAAIRMDLA